MVDDLVAIAKANQLCNQYGLDTISAGGIIGFAMEAYEKGILTKKDTDGLELTWGNGAAVVEMVHKMGKGEGIGKAGLLAQCIAHNPSLLRRNRTFNCVHEQVGQADVSDRGGGRRPCAAGAGANAGRGKPLFLH